MNTGGWAIIVVMAVLLAMWVTKPTCRDGFTPLFSFAAGWYCAPGYKP